MAYNRMKSPNEEFEPSSPPLKTVDGPKTGGYDNGGYKNIEGKKVTDEHNEAKAKPGMFPHHVLGANPMKAQGTQWAQARIQSTFHDRRGD